MRYVLRNKAKLIKVFGEDYYDLLIKSLSNHFKLNNVITEFEYETDKRYKIIHVDNVQPHTDSFFEFYVISKTFDVYLLAYKSACG